MRYQTLKDYLSGRRIDLLERVAMFQDLKIKREATTEDLFKLEIAQAQLNEINGFLELFNNGGRM